MAGNLLQVTNLLQRTNNLQATNSLQVANQLIPSTLGVSGFLLEDSSGVILLEDGSTLLLETQ